MNTLIMQNNYRGPHSINNYCADFKTETAYIIIKFNIKSSNNNV